MFCEKCGAQIEPGEMFCGNCGARIENSAPAPAYTPAYTPSVKKSGVGTAALSGSGMDIKMIVAGAVMLIASFLPMIHIKIGKLGELAREYYGDFFGSYFSELKCNIYKFAGFVDEYSVFGIPKWVKVMTILAVIFMIATIAVSIAAGVLKNRNLLTLSGIMCGICFLGCVAYMIYAVVILNRFNNAVVEDLGIFGAAVADEIRIRSINGSGLYLFLVGSGLQTYFSISGANKAA